MVAGGCWRSVVIGDIGIEDGGEESSGGDAGFEYAVVDCGGSAAFVVRGLRSELVRLGGIKAVSWRVDEPVLALRVSWLWYLRKGKSCTVGAGASSVSSRGCCAGPDGLRGLSKLPSWLW